MATNKGINLSQLIKKDSEGWRREKKKIPRLLANEMVNDFKENFNRQGFRDSSTKKWKKRKNNVDPGRAVLVGPGGGRKLSRSIKQITVNQSKVVVGSTVHYAGVHNYGLRSGRGKGFIMPQRKFVGNSKKLNRKLVKLIIKRIDKGFDK